MRQTIAAPNQQVTAYMEDIITLGAGDYIELVCASVNGDDYNLNPYIAGGPAATDIPAQAGCKIMIKKL
jgi:hypothetical protein